MGKLSGKIAVITGGNSGMGLATARLFAAQGAKVVITGRRQKDLDDAVKSVGQNIEGVQGDVSNLADLDRLYAHLERAYDRVDVLFANAGIGSFAPLGQVTGSGLRPRVRHQREERVLHGAKLLPLISDGGSILLGTSIAANSGMEAFSVYSATKAAMRSFARTWTTDLQARQDPRVNAISPGPIETPIFEQDRVERRGRSPASRRR